MSQISRGHRPLFSLQDWGNFTKEPLSKADQMANKFIICLEGNDVSTGLKWGLNSQSVVFMPPPTIVSWLMEDRLVPWVHYVPLHRNFTDLESRYLWAVKHPTECRRIAAAATRYMDQFRSMEVERRLMRGVVDFYMDHDAAPAVGAPPLPRCEMDRRIENGRGG